MSCTSVVKCEDERPSVQVKREETIPSMEMKRESSRNERSVVSEVEARSCDTYCRLCASQDMEEMLEIFSEDENSHIAEKISRCLPIIVFPSDELSLFICHHCLTKLNTSYELIISALEAEIFLKATFLSEETLQSSEKIPCEYLFQEECSETYKEQPQFEETQDRMICEVLLEDNGSVRMRRLAAGKSEMNDDCGSSCGNTSAENCNTDTKVWLKEVCVDKSIFPSITIEGPVMCDICCTEFVDMDVFDEHISKDHLLKCRLCDVGFEMSDDLLAHKILKHPENMVACEKCNFKKPEYNKEHLNGMLKSHKHRNSEYSTSELCVENERVCEEAVSDTKSSLHLCGKPEFPSSLPSEKHIFVHRERYQTEEVLTQKTSNKMCSESQRFELIIKKRNEDSNGDAETVNDNAEIRKAETASYKNCHRRSTTMQCVTCYKVFTNETFYKRHRYIHDPEYWDRYKCKVCNRPCRDAQGLANHTQLHSGIKPYMCDLCGRTYNRHANMLKHRKLHKPPNQWKHVCIHCQAKFEKIRDLMTHIERSHGTEYPESGGNSKSGNKAFRFICRFCGKRISTKLSLQDHERIHTGLKPFICEWCGREFRSRPNLSQHHLTHTGDRKHACETCGKKFSRKSFVVQHMRVHTGEKPYECNICGNRFTQAGDMRRHRRRHLEVKMDTAYFVDVPTDNQTILVKVQATS